MTVIRPIKSYSQGIYGSIKSTNRENTADTKISKECPATITQPELKKQYCADEIFQHMSSSYAHVRPSNEIKVFKTVSSESQERIQQTVKQFNRLFNETFNIIRNEFGDILSDDAMNTLTLQLLT